MPDSHGCVSNSLPPFSVLMSVYQGDEPGHVAAALESLCYQTLPPSEIVLVRDGPVSHEVQGVIDQYRQGAIPVRYVPLEKNVGAGRAWNLGMTQCSHDIVARMDADDVCLPHRFAAQLPYLVNHPEIDMVGGWIDEMGLLRAVEETPEAILRDVRVRNPINHVTVMFRKAAVLAAGGYQDYVGFADYYLWIRMLRNGSRFANVPQVLVNVRAGNDDWCRRRAGLGYIKREIHLQTLMYRWGLIGLRHWVYNVVTRTTFRLLPIRLRAYLYRNVLRTKVAAKGENSMSTGFAAAASAVPASVAVATAETSLAEPARRAA